MKKTEQKGIIIGFLFALIIFIVSIFYLLFNIYPSIKEIEVEKKILKEKVEKYNELNGKGFDYNTFKKLNNKYSNTEDKELKELIKGGFYNSILPKIDQNLYEKLIYSINEQGESKIIGFEKFEILKDFKSFLINKLNILTKKQESDTFIEKNNKLQRILPIYASFSNNKNKKLTDFIFVNYVEKLLNKFEIATNSQIGIKAIKEVESDLLDKKSDIFYIPLDLDISGTKGSILKFLTFIKNTGDIELKNNDFVFSNKQGSTYQLSEVSSITFDKYIDSSHKQRSILDDDLLDFLYKTEQSNDIIKVQISLRFYVSKVAKDKILEEINSIIGTKIKKEIKNKDGNNTMVKYELIHYNINNLRKIASNLNSNPIVNKNSFYKQKAEKIFLYLNNSKLKKEITAIKKEIKTTKDINKIYNKVLKYKKIFIKLDYEIYKIAKDLQIAETEIDKKTNKVISKSIYPKDYIFKNK